jgi:hypothetical protein
LRGNGKETRREGQKMPKKMGSMKIVWKIFEDSMKKILRFRVYRTIIGTGG